MLIQFASFWGMLIDGGKAVSFGSNKFVIHVHHLLLEIECEIIRCRKKYLFVYRENTKCLASFIIFQVAKNPIQTPSSSANYGKYIYISSVKILNYQNNHIAKLTHICYNHVCNIHRRISGVTMSIQLVVHGSFLLIFETMF